MPKIKSKRVWGDFFPEYELRRRESGFRRNLGWEGDLKYSLYSSLIPCTSWDPSLCDNNKLNQGASGVHHGGIFNLEFSPDGKQLVTACEKEAIMIFDPLTRRQIHDVPQAHSSCVNGIKFLDNRVFATCSDDKTVALWDVRNLSRKILRLRGHDNWVKNIEYSSEDSLLVTSGFDGRILGWNINKYTEESLQFSELFSMQGLMRMRLTPDLTKLIICTTGGYMVLVHNLSLRNLATDFKDFKPNMYRLMQISNTPLPQPAKFTSLFHGKRNRIEFLSDFPKDNDAEVIHSLQVHPQGWSVLSRNTSTEDKSEWTCVHDIQDLETTEELEEKPEKQDDEDSSGYSRVSCGNSIVQDSNPFYFNSPSQPNRSIAVNVNEDEDGRNLHLALTLSPRVEIMLRHLHRGERDDGSEEEEDEGGGVRDEEELRTIEETRSGHFGRMAGLNVQFRFTSSDVFEALEHIELRRQEERRLVESSEAVAAGPSGESTSSSSTGGRVLEAASQEFRLRRRRDTDNPLRYPTETASTSRNRINSLDYRNAFFIQTGLNNQRAILVLPPCRNYNRILRRVDKNHKIAKNIPRLTNFIEEPNKGRGFIKELCFSSDGRLICSPFDWGVRLLMFDEKCSELSHCVQKTPQQLCAVSTNICHTNCVVSTKFSPIDCLLVSGCLDGKIVWHQPII